jgi:uncharacterized membrane-anchored protein
MQEHPLRRTLSDELHARAFHDFDGAGRVIRFVFLVGNDDRAAVSYINEFMVKNRLPVLDGGTNFCRHEMAGYALRIERHTEFLTISFLQSGLKAATGLAANAFDEELLGHMPFVWARQTPAPLFHAIWVEVGGKPPRRLSQQTMIEHLESRAVASNNFSDLAAQVHFAFDIDNSGFSRVVIFNSAIVGSRMGRIVQRVVEIETYRLLALLGLSTVKAFSGRLGAAEDLVSNLTNDLAEQIKLPDGQVQTLLSILSTQAAEVEEIYSQTSYRLSATTAYLKILNARLDGMRLARLSGFQGVRGFLDRRMAPAMQSCSAFSERLSSLSRRISRAGQLLRTQTELIIQRQNRDLLQSMNERAKHQLRLQQTVERLSIAAVTYYGVGLVGYVATTLPIDRWGMSLTYIKAGAVPVIAFLVWLAIRRVRETAASPEKSD